MSDAFPRRSASETGRRVVQVTSGDNALSFHLDDENLDPKPRCRFPILSGGFERELAELREYVAGLR